MTSAAQIVGVKNPGTPPGHTASSHARLQRMKTIYMMRLHSRVNAKSAAQPVFFSSRQKSENRPEDDPELGAYKCRESLQISWFLRLGLVPSHSTRPSSR